MTRPSSAYVDVHHHFNAPGGRGGRATWSPQGALSEMDRAGVALAVGWPGPVIASGNDAGRSRARSINEFGAGIVQSRPLRFGLFASLPPLNDVDGALLEIDYALDTLHADGIGLTTHYEDGWLGDARFRPVFSELDRRAALVFVHPAAASTACGCGALGYQQPPITPAWLEYPFNTARAILSLMTSGTLRAFPAIRFIFCHGGGAFTPLLSRLEGFSGWFEIGREKLDEMFPQGVHAEFVRLHFECAQAYAPQNMALLRSLVPDTQILFGTDYDRFSIVHSVERFEQLDLSENARQAIESGNARRLLARSE